MSKLLIITCDKRQVETIVKEFEDWKLKPEIELDILLYGVTQKTKDGFLLIEIKKPLPEGVYTNLVTDNDILDYVLCHLTPPSNRTPTS